ncbi:MAG: DUF4907 domain-containing protein [Ferruginibacter sp.]|nr:DUF4907 domain-containing protein [Ferruginibacter sp.]
MKHVTLVYPAGAHRLRHTFSLILLLITVFSGTIVQAQTKIKKQSPGNAAPVAKPGQQLSYEIIPVAQNSFGYNIFSGTKKLVHQPSVPGLPGNKGFMSKADAEKCAQLVLHKINHNIMPPTVTRQELDSLHIKL